MMPGHALGATGAGDVKLMAAVGAIVGPALVLSAFLFTAIAGGVLALIVAMQTPAAGRDARGDRPADGRTRIGGAGDQGRVERQPVRIRTRDRDRQRARGAHVVIAFLEERAMKRLRNQKGAALLETAITLPLVLLVCVSIFEFGRAYQTWQVLTNAAREGARVAILSESTDAQVTTAVQGLHAGRSAAQLRAREHLGRAHRAVCREQHRIAHHDQLSLQVHRSEPGHAPGEVEFHHGAGHDHDGLGRDDAERELSATPVVLNLDLVGSLKSGARNA